MACHELKVGDRLLCEDGTWATAEDLLDTGEWETVHNLRVADYHTYFVGTDEWGFSVWAHNANSSYGGPLDPADLARAARRREGADLGTQVSARKAIVESVAGIDDPALAGKTLFEKLNLNGGKQLNLTVASDAAGVNQSHLVYVFKAKGTDEIVYVGKTSGPGTPLQALNKRLVKPHEHYDAAVHDVEIVEVLSTKYAAAGGEEVYMVGLREQGAKLINSLTDWGVGYDNATRAGKSLDRLQTFLDEVKRRRAGN